MIDLTKRRILYTGSIANALFILNNLHTELTLFVVNDDGQLVGTLTDGDIRRGLLNNASTSDRVERVMERNFSFLKEGAMSPAAIAEIRRKGVTLVPVLDDAGRIVKIMDLSKLKAVLPVDAVLMAGGEGKRLRPMTASIPKSLLPVGGKPIMEHMIDWIVNFGIENIHACIGYRGEQIRKYFGDGTQKGVHIHYLTEKEPLGTIGSVRTIPNIHSDYLLVANADILTNLDLEDFFADFIARDADVSVAAVPYKVSIPYAVLETHADEITSLQEKPTYTYYSNAGIYLMKTSAIEFIAEGFFDATDLIEVMLKKKKKVVYFKVQSYWMDIGSHADYQRANEDVTHIK